MPTLSLPTLPSRPTCTACPLHLTAKSVGVPSIWLPTSLPPGEGPIVIMLGRNPGRQENDANEPFVGKSGAILKKGYIASSGLDKLATIYLFNTVRCFTPADKEPAWATHVRKCFPHTLEDLRTVFTRPSLPFASNSTLPKSLGVPTPLTSTSGCSRTATPSSPRKLSVVCLGGMASRAFVALALGEKPPKSQAEAFRNNARVVSLSSPPATSVPSGDPAPTVNRSTTSDLFLLHTYHPSYYLRNPNCGQSIQEHTTLLTDWLQDRLVTPSRPILVKPYAPGATP